ncbi:MAG TPA: peroxidase-related enzyme [Xanthobacteraceae bacterium]
MAKQAAKSVVAIQPKRPRATAGDDIETTALKLKAAELSPEMVAYFAKCVEKLGFVPNVLKAYAFDSPKLSAFVAMYNDLMLAPSGLSKLERELIAVAVSAQNRCYYCLVAHGAAVRQLSGDPPLGELMVMNYRAARLSKRERAMLDFAVKLTAEPWLVEEEDRARLRDAGFSERDIWDIAAVAGFFNMTNRVASATDMRPNPVYHGQAR